MLHDGPAPFRPGCGARTAAADAGLHPKDGHAEGAAHHLARYHGPPVEFPDRYTLIVNSYQRHALLERAIAHYAQCQAIDAIRVVWCEDGLPPTRSEEPGLYSESKEVRYDVMPSPSLNSRFWPLEGLRTEAVLSIDDDIQVPCSEVDRLFLVWQANRRNLVGFYPRLHVLNKDCSYKYLAGFGTLTWWGMYSMVLTKAAFLHRDYLEHYTNHMAPGLRSYVDTVRNCEDLAMQFLVANVTGEAPLFVHSSRVLDLGKGLFKVQGISSSINHNQERSACLNEFAARYGGTVPLKVRRLSDAPRAWLLRISPQLDAVYAVLKGHL